MKTRTAFLLWSALTIGWTTGAGLYLYPDVKEEIEEKRYLHRVEKLHTPVLPLECGRARGVENRDFILRGQRLGKVLGDDRDLQFALPGDR